MPRLKLLKGKANWEYHQLDLPREMVGRDPIEASAVLDDTTLAVSRKHAEFLREGNRYYIVDQSRWGTRLNGRRLQKRKRYLLAPNDLIQMCHYIMTYLDNSEEDSSAEAMVPLVDDKSSGFSHLVPQSSDGWERRKSQNTESKLSAIMDLSRKLRRCKSMEELLDNALDSLLGAFPQAFQGIVVLRDDENRIPPKRVVRFRLSDHEGAATVSLTAIEEVSRRQAAGLSENQLTICASLVDERDKSLGVIVLSATRDMGLFNEADLDLLATVAVHLAISVENRILHETTLRARELQMELKVAHDVQIGLLPAEPPQIAGYEFFDYYAPARQVGGDYYDYTHRDDRHLAIALGDVAGKGIPAALHMARVASELSVYLASGLSPSAALQQINPRSVERNPRGTFVTMVLGVLDYTTHEMVLVNAGHMLPLLRRADGTVTQVRFTDAGLPLGIAGDQRYGERRISIAPGETIVFYSDGITDAANVVEQRYSLERLRGVLRQATGNARNLGKSIMDDIQDFVGEAQQADDMCLVCVGRLPVA